MCGRYDLVATAEELARRFGVPLRELSVTVLQVRALVHRALRVLRGVPDITSPQGSITRCL